MSAVQRGLIVRVARERAKNNVVTMVAAAEVDPIFARWWQGGLRSAPGGRSVGTPPSCSRRHLS